MDHWRRRILVPDENKERSRVGLPLRADSGGYDARTADGIGSHP